MRTVVPVTVAVLILAALALVVRRMRRRSVGACDS
jgi:hypothetical protein